METWEISWDLVGYGFFRNIDAKGPNPEDPEATLREHVGVSQGGSAGTMDHLTLGESLKALKLLPFLKLWGSN